MSLCESVLAIIEAEAQKQAFQAVRAVRLEIGALSHVEPEAMAFCFEAVTKGTIASGARLEILRPPGQAWCMDCERSVTVGARFDPCPDCGGHKLHVTGGDELRIKDLEVD
ncbi:MAG: hydrogenase maturation nickel metallochaperone HypA [Caulobacterales bacterium]|nr:hydrogenase maturation nickel metallochaperone HypA [Caulobacterales bacterium]